MTQEREDYMRRQEADHALLDMRTRKPFDSAQRERMKRMAQGMQNATPQYDANAFRPATTRYRNGDLTNGYPWPISAQEPAAPTPATEQYFEDIGMATSADESGTYRLTTGQFLLASVVVIIGAIALVL